MGHFKETGIGFINMFFRIGSENRSRNVFPYTNKKVNNTQQIKEMESKSIKINI